MPLPVITDTIRCAVRGTTAISTRWMNVLHFRGNGILTTAGAIAVIDPLLYKLYGGPAFSAGNQSWSDPATNNWKVDDIVYTPLDGIGASTVIPHVKVGSSAPDALPPGVALVFTLRTAKRGRAYRGRCYWAGYSESTNATTGEPQSSTVTGQLGQWAGLLSALSGSGCSLVVASYLHSTAENVVSVTCDGLWDSQRRRNR